MQRESPYTDLTTRLFGFDFFVSFALGPPPRGTRPYASDLVRQLRERGFSVFFSEDALPPGRALTSDLMRALERSKALLVVCNHASLLEPRWIREEVEQFRRLRPEDPVIPVSLDAALQGPDVPWSDWLQHRSVVWLAETADAAAASRASFAILERIAIYRRVWTTRRLWRAFQTVALSVLAATGTITWSALREAQSNAAHAKVSQEAAVQAQGIAEAKEAEAQRERKAAEHSATEARTAASRATQAELAARKELAQGVSTRLAFEAQEILRGDRAGDLQVVIQSVLIARALSSLPEVVGASMNAGVQLQPLLRTRVIDGWADSEPASAMVLEPYSGTLVLGDTEGNLQFVSLTTLEAITKPVSLNPPYVSRKPRPERIVIHPPQRDGEEPVVDSPVGEVIYPRSKIVGLYIIDGGRALLAARQDGVMQVWDIAKRQPLGAGGSVHPERLDCVAVGGDGRSVVTVGEEDEVKLSRVERASIIPTATIHVNDLGHCNEIDVNEAGSLAVLSTTRGITLLNLEARREVEIGGPKDGPRMTRARFGKDANQLMLVDEDGRPHIFDLSTETLRSSRAGGRVAPKDVHFDSQDRSRALVVTKAGDVEEWNLTGLRRRALFQSRSLADRGSVIIFGDRMLTWNGEASIAEWLLSPISSLGQLPAPQTKTAYPHWTHARVDPSNGMISALRDHELHRWDRHGIPIGTWPKGVRVLGLSEDGIPAVLADQVPPGGFSSIGRHIVLAGNVPPQLADLVGSRDGKRWLARADQVRHVDEQGYVTYSGGGLYVSNSETALDRPPNETIVQRWRELIGSAGRSWSDVGIGIEGRTAFGSTSTGEVYVWKLDAPAAAPRLLTKAGYGAAIGTDEALVATIGYERIELHDLRRKTAVVYKPHQRIGAGRLTFDESGQYLVAAGHGQVQIFDVWAGRPVGDLLSVPTDHEKDVRLTPQFGAFLVLEQTGPRLLPGPATALGDLCRKLLEWPDDRTWRHRISAVIDPVRSCDARLRKHGSDLRESKK